MTFHTVKRACAAGVIAIGLGWAQAQPALADGKTPTIGVVDVQVILQRSEAAKSVQQAIEGYRQSLAKEFSGREEKLREAEEELGRQRQALSAEAFAKKRREFEQKVAEYQRDVQTRQRSIDQSINEAMGTIQKTLVDVVKSVAEDQGVTLVLSGQQVVWLADKSLDLTPPVLDDLNKRLPRVSVKLSDGKK